MRKGQCETCGNTFDAPSRGPLPTQCSKHRFLSTCRSCTKTFNGLHRVEVLCSECRTSKKNCADCGEPFKPSPKGKVSTLCPKCRKKKQLKQSANFQKKRTLEERPILPCIDCGGPVPKLKTKRYVRCESCMELHKKNFEINRRSVLKAGDPHFDRRRDLKR